MQGEGAEIAEKRGRRRRFDGDTERTMLLDAAIRLMASRGYGEMSVAELLAEAGLSTRSFYRHFESKDALLTALFTREVASVAGHLERAVAHAADCLGAVDAWLDAFLDTFYEQDRAGRSALFTAPAVLSAYSLPTEFVSIRSTLCQPLALALQSGHDDGSIQSPDPYADAVCIFGLVTAAVFAAEGEKPDRAAVRGRVQRFVHPALTRALWSGPQ